MTEPDLLHTIIEVNLFPDDTLGVAWEEGISIPKARGYLQRALAAFDDMVSKIEKGEMDEFGKPI